MMIVSLLLVYLSFSVYIHTDNAFIIHGLIKGFGNSLKVAEAVGYFLESYKGEKIIDLNRS